MADFEGVILQPSQDKMRRLQREVKRLSEEVYTKNVKIETLEQTVGELKTELKFQITEARRFRLLNNEKLRKIKTSVETKPQGQGTRDGPLAGEKPAGNTPLSLEENIDAEFN